MRKLWKNAWLLATPLVRAGEPMSPGLPPDVAFSPCELAEVARPGRCGVVEVPENPRKPEGRRLRISIAVLPAASGSATKDPVVPLMGGPGEEAISAAGYFVERFGSLLQNRDLVLIDQRGTGKSAALRCDLHSPESAEERLRDFLPIAGVRRCAEHLRRQASLNHYTNPHVAGDLEIIRKALGYDAINLFAASYGTRAAQVYVRSYPKSVRTVFFGSIVPIDVETPLTMARAAQDAMDKVLDACAADSSCRAAYPNLREEFSQILSRLDAGVRVRIPRSDAEALLHRGRVAEWLRSRLYSADSASEVPWLIHQASIGNWTPIVEGILAYANGFGSAVSAGVFLLITCSDDVAFLREQDIEANARGTFLGDYRVRQQMAACRHWPATPAPPDYRIPVTSSVPAFFVSGDTDPASPLRFTRRAAPGFTDRVEVELRGRGHTEWNDCVRQLYIRFVESGTTRAIAGEACNPGPRPPFKLTSGMQIR